jgi:hypothetical protein
MCSTPSGAVCETESVSVEAPIALRMSQLMPCWERMVSIAPLSLSDLFCVRGQLWRRQLRAV